MRTQIRVMLLMGIVLPRLLHAQVNSWTNTPGGKWETGANWSLGVPPTNTQSGIFITNAVTKTVTNDATTSGSFPGTMTINNLQVSAPSGATNTLSLANAGLAVPLHLINSFTISDRGALTITNSAVLVDGTAPVAWAIDGTVTFLDGSIVSTNVSASRNLVVGDVGRGEMTVAGGSLSAFGIYVGNAAGAQGTLTISGGTNVVTSLFVAPVANATGTVWMTGGLLTGSFGTSIRVGNSGVGQMVVSNGSVRAFDVALRGPSCTLTIAGGEVAVASTLQIPNTAGSTGSVWLAGGQLTVTNGTSSVAPDGSGQMTISNATFLARDLSVASGFGNGTLTIAGGTTVLSSNLTVAGGAVGRTGTVWIVGGTLVTTNASTSIGVQGFGRFTVSNGTWLARRVVLGEAFAGVGTLSVSGGTNAMTGPLTIGAAASATGTVWVTGGSLVITNTPATVGAGSGLIIDGSVTVTNGSSIIVSNLATVVGNRGSGSLTVSGGSMTVSNLTVADLAGSQGTLTLDSGTLQSASNFLVGNGGTGAVWITGGQLIVTNQAITVGSGIVGQMTVSNGTVLAANLFVGSAAGSQGTLTLAGGTIEPRLAMTVGSAVSSTGAVWVTGGLLAATNQVMAIGNFGIGQMTISNGTVQAQTMFVGRFVGSRGTLTVAGGTTTASGMVLGTSNCSATGVVNVVGGQLVVTNLTGTARIDVQSGTLLFQSGTLTVDQLIVTNFCARFIHTGGTLMTGSITNTPAFDADGDGLSNQYETDNGLDPYNPFDDADGDGQSNLGELLAGTNPTNSASALRITAVAKEGDDIRITWMTSPDKTNALERTAGDGSGNFTTNNFAAIFTVTNTVGTVTNHLDIGAATNFPSRYYRVRLVP